MTADRRRRLLRLAAIRKDRLSLATLNPRRWVPDAPDYLVFVGLQRRAA